LAEQKTVSLRVSTRGELAEFLERESKDCAYSNKVISGIIGILWNYKEEGVELSPAIVFADDIVAFSKKLPGFSRLVIGCCVSSEDAAKAILKDCAPLTGESSLIFVERCGQGEKLVYGIFSFLRSPTAIGIEEVLTLDDTQFAVLIKKSSPTTLQVAGSKGNSVSILMSTIRENDNSETEISKFIEDVVSDLKGETDDFKKYLSRLLFRMLTQCHGTILLCANGDIHENSVSLKDRISLDEEIDLFGLFDSFCRLNDAESLLMLQRAEELLKGFLSCDGMITFSTEGKIVAYRVFYEASEKGDAPAVVGGARRRAFAGVSTLNLDELKSALFRSQDGTTEYKEVSNGTK
jgi:hypothetical protein